MSQPQTCFGCQKSAPETETSYTLISSAHGWRVSREKDENGEPVARWRCADCWRKFKELRVGESTPSPSSSRRR